MFSSSKYDVGRQKFERSTCGFFVRKEKRRFQRKDNEIVPYRWSAVCHLATRAALYLSEQGYRVHELAGGIEYWKNYKLPVEGKRS
jgi:rhodanese-related sulfurtransferase